MTSSSNWHVGWLEPGQYSWRMEAYNSAGYSGWTEHGYFNVIPSRPPEKPVLVSPGQGEAVAVNIPVVLRWGEAYRADEYQVELFVNGIKFRESGRISQTSWDVGNLEANTYEWSVEAHNAVGFSGWTQKYQFTVSSGESPNVPKLRTPSQNAIFRQCTPVVLEWEPASSATEYMVELWQGSRVLRPPDRLTSTSWNAGVLDNGDYWWQVEAYHGFKYSGWSERGTFRVISDSQFSHSISGRLFSASGRVFVGEPVYLDGHDPVVTDDSGRYTFDSLPPGTYRVHVGKRHGVLFSPAHHEISLPSEGAEQLDFNQFIDDVEKYTISGRITDAQGEGVKNVTISTYHGSMAVTDENGKYSFVDYSVGWITIEPYRRGYIFLRTSDIKHLPTSGGVAIADFVATVNENVLDDSEIFAPILANSR